MADSIPADREWLALDAEVDNQRFSPNPVDRNGTPVPTVIRGVPIIAEYEDRVRRHDDGAPVSHIRSIGSRRDSYQMLDLPCSPLVERRHVRWADELRERLGDVPAVTREKPTSHGQRIAG